MKLQLPRPKQEDIGLNLTPLIDVVFLLLIFLLVTTSFTRQSFLDIELPSLRATTPVPDSTVEVWLHASGELWINGQRWEAHERSLESALAIVLTESPQASIVLMPDPSAPSQGVLDVLSALGALGQTRVIFSGADRVEP